MTKTIMRNKKRNILRTVLLILVGIIVGFNLYLWNAGKLLKNQLPMPFGYGVSVVLSGSMEPALAENELVLIKKTDSFQIGDIVVYQKVDKLIIHRVISVENDTVVTKGDANSIADDPISVSDVKGVMIGGIPYVGWIVRILKKPFVSLAVLTAAFLMLELSYSRKNQKDEAELEKIREEIRRLKNNNGNK